MVQHDTSFYSGYTIQIVNLKTNTIWSDFWAACFDCKSIWLLDDILKFKEVYI